MGDFRRAAPLGQGIAMVGGANPAKVTKVLKSFSFNTVLGNIGFDRKGDVKAPGYVVYEWKNGKYKYYK